MDLRQFPFAPLATVDIFRYANIPYHFNSPIGYFNHVISIYRSHWREKSTAESDKHTIIVHCMQQRNTRKVYS